MEERKDCRSCKFEPHWKWYSPITDQQIGQCKNPSAFYCKAEIVWSKDPACVALVLTKGSEAFTNCPAWIAKDAEGE